MTDRKKTPSRSRTTTVRATPKSQPNKAETTAKSVEASTGEKTEKAVKASTRETTRREPVKQESKTTARRDTKGSTSLVKRLRNNRIGRFLYEAYYELRYKVTWPTFREARNMTLVVIALSAVIGALLAGVDVGLHRLFLFIIGAQ